MVTIKKDEFYPIKIIAGVYEVSEQSVYNWIKDGMNYRKVKEIGKRPHYETRVIDVEEYHAKKGTA